jgi:HKD family nuclease
LIHALRFLDSSQTGRHVRLLFKTATQADIAVAYLKKDGVALIRGPLTRLLKRGGRIRVVVAVDPFGITEGHAVATLYKLLSMYPTQAKMRYYRDNAFHPKLYIFKSETRVVAIIGSSNLTRAAMESNIEANFLVAGEPSEPSIQTIADYYEQAIWNPCHGRLSSRLLSKLRRYDSVKPRMLTTSRRIDVEIPSSRIPRHALPRVRRARRQRIVRPPQRGALPDAVVIRYIPRASGRVAQVHFTREIIERFYRLPLGSRELIILQQRQPSERPKKIERRTLIYSIHNKNPKIELDGAKILVGNYPTLGRPIVVLHALGSGRYRYMLRLPAEAGYRELADVLDREPRRGLALPFKITDADTLREIWPSYR